MLNKKEVIIEYISQYQCDECYGIGEYNSGTPPLDTTYGMSCTIKGNDRGKFYHLNTHLCTGCEGTGLNIDIQFDSLVKEIKEKFNIQ